MSDPNDDLEGKLIEDAGTLQRKLADAEARLRDAEREGRLRRCDIPACNCGGYHSELHNRIMELATARADAEARAEARFKQFRELADFLKERFPNEARYGGAVYRAMDLLAELHALREVAEAACLSRRVSVDPGDPNETSTWVAIPREDLDHLVEKLRALDAVKGEEDG